MDALLAELPVECHLERLQLREFLGGRRPGLPPSDRHENVALGVLRLRPQRAAQDLLVGGGVEVLPGPGIVRAPPRAPHRRPQEPDQLRLVHRATVESLTAQEPDRRAGVLVRRVQALDCLASARLQIHELVELADLDAIRSGSQP